MGKFCNLEHEVDLTRGQLKEESQSKADALRVSWRCTIVASKRLKECLARAEEFESAKLILEYRLAEAEGTVMNFNGKATAIEKEKINLQSDIEKMSQNQMLPDGEKGNEC